MTAPPRARLPHVRKDAPGAAQGPAPDRTGPLPEFPRDRAPRSWRLPARRWVTYLAGLSAAFLCIAEVTVPGHGFSRLIWGGVIWTGITAALAAAGEAACRHWRRAGRAAGSGSAKMAGKAWRAAVPGRRGEAVAETDDGYLPWPEQEDVRPPGNAAWPKSSAWGPPEVPQESPAPVTSLGPVPPLLPPSPPQPVPEPVQATGGVTSGNLKISSRSGGMSSAWSRVTSEAADCEPDSYEDLLEWLGQQVSGMASYAGGLLDAYEHLVTEVGVDPKALRSVLTCADVTAEAAQHMGDTRTELVRYFQEFRDAAEQGKKPTKDWNWVAGA